MGKKSTGKNQKASKSKPVHTKVNDEEEEKEDIEELFAKKKKQAPIAPKIDFKAQKAPKQKATPAQPVATPLATPEPVAAAAPAAPLTKKEKKAAAAAAAAKKEEPVVVVVIPTKKEEKKKAPEPLSEVELLKLRIAQLEGKAPEKKEETPAQPMSNRQAKKAAKAATAASPTPSAAVVVESPSVAAGKKDDKKKEHNPAPQMSEEQKKEQEEMLAQFEKERNQWREIPQYNADKKKKKNDNHTYVDLSVLTTQSTMTAKFGDRSVLVQQDGSGTNLDQISKLTGCKIDLQQRPTKEVMDKSPNRGADLPMKIDLEGTDDQIKEARAIINDLFTKGYSNALTPDKTETKLRVDPSDHFQIVGKGGATINKIMDATGAKITVPQKAKEGQAADDIIRIVGSAKAVADAKEAIKSIITNGFSDLTHDNWKKSQVDFPTNYRRYLLQGGPNSIIRTIENNTCKLMFPQSPSDQFVSIVGPAEKVDAATVDIKAVLAKLDQPVNDVYLVGFDSSDFKANELW